MTLAYIGTRTACLRALTLGASYYGVRLIGEPTWRRAGRDWRVEQGAA